jgi:hypothetical protein
VDLTILEGMAKKPVKPKKNSKPEVETPIEKRQKEAFLKSEFAVDLESHKTGEIGLKKSGQDDPGGEPLPEDVKRQEQAAGQADLDKKREKRDIKKDKIEGRKTGEPVESMTGFSGAYPKAHQTRKKGK